MKKEIQWGKWANGLRNWWVRRKEEKNHRRKALWCRQAFRKAERKKGRYARMKKGT